MRGKPIPGRGREHGATVTAEDWIAGVGLAGVVYVIVWAVLAS